MAYYCLKNKLSHKGTILELITKTDIGMELVTLSPKDYERLEFVEFNREIDLDHIRVIKNSIIKFGFLSPVIVIRNGESFTIIDGQHRAYSGIEIKCDIPLAVLQDVRLKQLPEIIAKLNTTSKRWQLVDYYKLYNKMEKIEYQGLKRFLEKTNMSLRAAVYLHSMNPLKNLVQNKADFKSFKGGTWSPSVVSAEYIKKLIGDFQTVRGFIQNKELLTYSAFNDSLVKIMLHPKFDLQKMIANIDHYNYSVLPYAPHGEHFEGLQNLYNRTNKGKLSFDYQTALDGSIVTSENEAQAIRGKFVNIEQYAEMSPYSENTIVTVKKLQPNKGRPDITVGRRKFWTLANASKWANKQHSQKDTSLKDTHKRKPDIMK